MIPPAAIGNADPEWQRAQGFPWGPGVARPQTEVRMIQVEVEQNPLPNKCRWGLLLLSVLLVLHVQQGKIAAILRWRAGVVDKGDPFPWEYRELVSGNDSFETTFVTPMLSKASTFLGSSSGPTVVTGLSQIIVAGGDSPGGKEAEHKALADVSAVNSAARLSLSLCPENSSVCFLGAKRVMDVDEHVSCHSFVSGASVLSMNSIDNRFCVRAKALTSVVPTLNDTVVVHWETADLSDPLLRHTCLAAVSLSGVIAANTGTSWANTVFFDPVALYIVTVGFTTLQTLVVTTFDTSLAPRWRYQLPISVAWLLRSRMSDGYLILVGSEQPFLGTAFIVDLVNQVVYEQDAASVSEHREKPQRRRLPKEVVEKLTRLPGGYKNLATRGGPCAATASPSPRRTSSESVGVT